jgi:hypothetical protein
MMIIDLLNNFQFELLVEVEEVLLMVEKVYEQMMNEFLNIKKRKYQSIFLLSLSIE